MFSEPITILDYINSCPNTIVSLIKQAKFMVSYPKTKNASEKTDTYITICSENFDMVDIRDDFCPLKQVKDTPENESLKIC